MTPFLIVNGWLYLDKNTFFSWKKLPESVESVILIQYKVWGSPAAEQQYADGHKKGHKKNSWFQLTGSGMPKFHNQETSYAQSDSSMRR